MRSHKQYVQQECSSKGGAYTNRKHAADVLLRFKPFEISELWRRQPAEWQMHCEYASCSQAHPW